MPPTCEWINTCPFVTISSPSFLILTSSSFNIHLFVLQFYGPLGFHPDTTYENLISTPPQLSTSPYVENQSLYWVRTQFEKNMLHVSMSHPYTVFGHSGHNVHPILAGSDHDLW